MLEYDNFIYGILEILLICLYPILLFLAYYYNFLEYSTLSVILTLVVIFCCLFMIYKSTFKKSDKRGDCLLLFQENENSSGYFYLLNFISLLFLVFVFLDMSWFRFMIMGLLILANFLNLIFLNLLDQSANGIYQKGIEKNRFIKWQDIIYCKIDNKKIYIKVKNKNLGMRNDFLMCLGEFDSIDKKYISKIINKKMEK